MLPQVGPLNENDLDPVQLAKNLDEEIRALESKSLRLREEQIMRNTPPLSPANTEECQIQGECCNMDVHANVKRDHTGADESDAIDKGEQSSENAKPQATVSSEELGVDTDFEELDWFMCDTVLCENELGV